METPKIAERVKFWQEQDRINRELIPRVIKGHELLTKHVETHDESHLTAMSRYRYCRRGSLTLKIALQGRLVALSHMLVWPGDSRDCTIGVLGNGHEISISTS